MALIAQAAIDQLRKRLAPPAENWDAEHLAKAYFFGLEEGDVRVDTDTIIVTYYNAPDADRLRGATTRTCRQSSERRRHQPARFHGSMALSSIFASGEGLINSLQKSLLQRGGQRGWGPDQPAPSPPLMRKDVIELSPLAKGGPGGVGAGPTSSVATANAQAKPAHFPPLAKGGPRGGGSARTNQLRRHRLITA